ncbi:MAG: ABC transporter permease [Bacteroidota bacterium]
MKKPPVYHQPPQRVLRFLRWFCDDSFLEEVEGDLFEMFQEEVETYGLKKARHRFLWMALRYVNPYFFGKKEYLKNLQYQFIMLGHYLKISTRHLVKQRFYSIINIAGFAVGLAACLLIILFIKHETSYDRFHPEADRIYRIYWEGKIGETERKGAVTSTSLVPTLTDEFPEVEFAARIGPNMYESGNNQLRRSTEVQSVYEENFIYADPSFLEIFQFPMLAGDVSSALEDPLTMVITESKAQQFFGQENPIGQTMIINENEERPYKITGVVADLPTRTHLRFNYILSMEGVRASKVPNWGFNNYVSYVKLAEGATAASVEAKFPAMIQKHERPEIKDRLQEPGNYFRYVLQPVNDVHLKSADIRGYWLHGDAKYVWLFGFIAAFILLIASINFMNLTTARSANRAKEVGMRKVLGSARGQLFMQFLTESVLVSFIAFVIAVALAAQVLPFFNELTGKTLVFSWQQKALLLSVFGAAMLVGVLAGLYPAAFLSSFRPLKVLKGKLSGGSKRGGLRSTLVVVQFTTSIALIIGSLVVQKQIDFIQNKKLGFDKERLLIIEDCYTLGREKVTSLKNTLKNLPEVDNVSVTGYIPVDGYAYNGSGTWVEGTNPEESEVGLAKWYVDHDYVKTLGMEIVEGRDFSIDMPTDSSGILLNETAVSQLGLEDPIGKRVSSYTYLDQETGELMFDTYTVVGVLKDFHFSSMKEEIDGLSLVIGSNRFNAMVKAKTTDLQSLIKKAEAQWATFAPNQRFRYHFLDEQFDKMYTFEQRAGRIFSVLTALAIFIACLGLFALATFMAEQRSKEIGIRKVLGATVGDVVFMLTKNFALLVLISLVIATPLAWYFMNGWLADFAYRTQITWGVFALAGSSALLIALLSIGYQAVKAAIANPSDAIRDE